MYKNPKIVNEAGGIHLEATQDGHPDLYLSHEDEGYVEVSRGKYGQVAPLAMPTPEEQLVTLYKQFEQAVQKHLDDKAKSKGYDSILSACSYSGYANPFQIEGQKFTEWRGNVWDYCYEQLPTYTDQTTVPSVDDFINSLPTIEV